MPLHVSSIMCSSSGGQNFITQPLISHWSKITKLLNCITQPLISHWSKITKIQFDKYEQIVVKFMCEFFGCDYCVLLTINMLCHVEVMHAMLCRGYVYPFIKLIRKILCLFILA